MYIYIVTNLTREGKQVDNLFVPPILQVRGGRIPSPETNYAGGWTRSVVAL